jgi:hypothetical protein
VTLILTHLSRNFVIQVSDRRVVFVYPDGRCQLKEDDENKALFVDRSLIFAYTGLARIENKETILWLMDVLKPFADQHQLREGFFEVARRASVYFCERRLPPLCRLHTFIGAGWVRNKRNHSVFPIAMRITNAFDDSFRPTTVAREKFVIQRIRLQRLSGVSLIPAGAPVPASVLLRCSRILRRPYFLQSSLRSAQLLAREFRRLAASHPTNTIGQNLTVTCLPRSALNGSTPLVLGPPTDASPSSFYVLATGRRQVLRSPAVLMPGFPILLSDIGLDIPPPADQSDPYHGWR